MWRCHIRPLAGLDVWRVFSAMIKISYAGYRFHPELIQQAVWLYLRFTLAERGIMVSYLRDRSTLGKSFRAIDRGGPAQTSTPHDLAF
jgi:hypothetical protein